MDLYINPNLAVKKNKNENKSNKPKSNGTVKKGYGVQHIKSSAEVKKLEIFIDPKNIKEQYVAFVDGSYDKSTKAYGSGVIVLRDDNLYDTYSKAGYDEWDQWNIVGELKATKLAISKAKQKNIKNIAIYHDLKNISLWATDEWKAKNQYTQEYVRFIEEASKEMNIYFIKVKAHSDESVYNDLADEAAKKCIYSELNIGNLVNVE